MRLFFPAKTTPATLASRSTTALRLVVALSLAAACVMVLAQTRGVAPAAATAPAQGEPGLPQLERLFWLCDHAASTRGIMGSDGMLCGSATEQLKQRRFGGDFDAMLAWWRENKTAMHQALQRGERPDTAALASGLPPLP